MINDTAETLIIDYTGLFSSQVVINAHMEQQRQESTADTSVGIGKISRLGLELELLLIFTDSK
ncbi:MAG: hypothetical protein ACRC1D_02730 [Culicoidibacterales bacterium]